MNYHTVVSEQDEYIWSRLAALEGHVFKTARGLRYTYQVKRNRRGDMLGELVIDRKEKTITRATILLAYRNALAVQRSEGCVAGPKKLGVFGASYLYPIFLYLGVCVKTPPEA